MSGISPAKWYSFLRPVKVLRGANMKKRMLGKTGFQISEISLGTWQLGGKWGAKFDFATAEEILEEACSKGINFIDTADIYNGGDSERAIGRFLKGRSEKIFVATKCGRGVQNHNADVYTKENMARFVENSLKNMNVECLDLLQLHCPPTEVYYRPETFAALGELKKEGKIQNYGVSVEKVEEALKAIEYEGVATVQIIFNMFRQRPAQLFFKEAKRKNVGVIVRVPLASGLLSGMYTKTTAFGPGDHRSFNRNGEAFDKGETFAGVDYETGLAAVDRLKEIFKDESLVNSALKWILMSDEVGTVIPGASRKEQIAENIGAADIPPLTESQMRTVEEVYNKFIKEPVHHLW